MKIFNYSILMLLVLTGCSSSGDSSTPDQTAKFELNVNGVLIPDLDYKVVRKAGHHLHLGNNRTDTKFVISFDENGNFGRMVYSQYYPVPGEEKTYTSYRDFSSNYFNFYLSSYDQTNKRVKVDFDGYLYKDPTDRNSESKFVNGSFDMPYTEYVPPIAGIINEATINGTYWRGTNTYQTRDAMYNNLTIQSVSDDAYRIMISLNDTTGSLSTVPGVYNFTSSDLKNKVEISKFNPATSSYTIYNCTGTLTVTTRWINYLLQGTYSFTGVNPTDPTDVITVTNGNFKLVYNPNG